MKCNTNPKKVAIATEQHMQRNNNVRADESFFSTIIAMSHLRQAIGVNSITKDV